MKRCSVKPYEGEQNYIFVSYCHKDKRFVFPIIEQLVKDGYRVWYDEGIDPGSEWPEIIAHHLNSCASCIAFISENSLNSHNCRREINFALLKKKPFISVVLEEVHMSLGMEMQLSATQSIFKYTLSGDNEFFGKLYDAKFLKDCLGIPNPSVVVSSPEEYNSDVCNGLFSENVLKRETFSDKWFIERHELVQTKENNDYNITDSSDSGAALVDEPVKNDENTAEENEWIFWLIRNKTNEKIPLKNGETKLGRSDTMCDYAITGNSAVGRYHARIINSGLACSIVDNNSMNKTFLNTKELEPKREYLLHNGDLIRLANEKFTFRQTQE